MTKVYIINVGANTKHRMRARSPIFVDGSFVYVPLPENGTQPDPGYSDEALPFVRVGRYCSHADPDWVNLTYGDNCANPRALALLGVTVGDILLFWGLLWRNRGRGWASFSDERGWYLLGTLRVEEIAEPGPLAKVSARNQNRAKKNSHFVRSAGHLPENERVFLGDPAYSQRFARAIDLDANNPAGLLFKAFPSADGELLVHKSLWPAGMKLKPWESSLRSCRVLWDLVRPRDRALAAIARDAILKVNGFDLLKDI